jgi:hypothetical protein
MAAMEGKRSELLQAEQPVRKGSLGDSLAVRAVPNRGPQMMHASAASV